MFQFISFLALYTLQTSENQRFNFLFSWSIERETNGRTLVDVKPDYTKTWTYCVSDAEKTLDFHIFSRIG